MGHNGESSFTIDQITNKTRQTVLATTVDVADNPAKRMKGLLGKDHLPANNALLITPCNSIHMFFMRFAIDAIFINTDDKVVGLCPNLQPYHISPIFFKACSVIELPAGTIALTQTKLGDQIAFK